MISIAKEMYETLTFRINELLNENDILIRSELIVLEIETALTKLKNLIKQHGFFSEQDEIHFYKHIKPLFHALYIYHATIFNVESDKPIGSTKVCTRYFHNELRRIDTYFYHNLELYKYYRSGKTNLDKEYFTRETSFKGLIMDIIAPVIDNEFCTVHSVKVSFLIAYEQLKQYMQNQMLGIKTSQNLVFGTNSTQITWTDSKTGLVELAYALQASGSFNNGKADLKQVTDHLEKSFQVQLGNTSRTFQEILERKKGYTSFLDRLKKALVKRMMENDND